METKKPGRPPVADEKVQEVLSLHEEGKDPKKIRDVTGLGLTKVYEIIRAARFRGTAA